jgi:hypothetical protein
MGLISEKIRRRFYTLEREIKQRKPSRVSKYIFKHEMKILPFCTGYFKNKKSLGNIGSQD